MAAPDADMSHPRLLVLYGSETGTAQDIADRVGREAARRGWAPAVLPADAYAPAALPSETAAVFVVATTGQGEPPANLRSFWRFLLRRALPPGSLAPLPVAVFGLGDSGYAEFNVVAKKLAARLAQLGAAAVAPPGLADAAAPGGADAALDAWLPSLWRGLRNVGLEPPTTPPGREHPADDDVDGGLGAPRFEVDVLDPGPPPASPADYAPPLAAALAAHAAFAALDAAAAGAAAAPAGCSSDARAGRGAAAPAVATVASNVRTTAPTHFQDVRHIVFGVDPPTRHAPGDVAAFLPAQAAASIETVLRRLALHPAATLRVTSPAAPPSTPPVIASAAALVGGVVELDGASPRRRLFGVLAAHCPPGPGRDRLAEFAAPAGRDDLDLYCTSEGRTVGQVLDDFPSAAPPLPWLLAAAPRLRPRRFSIASCAADGASLEVAVAVVDYRTKHGRRVRGLASAWLASLPPGARAPLWVEAGSLPPPPLDAPLVLVGPGTGAAPLRAILQHRAAAAASATAAGAPRPPPCLLFVGCRFRDADCLFEADWAAAMADGTLAADGLHVAASRDQPTKYYVSHAIKAAAAAVWAALHTHRGALYLAGAAGAMPRGVRGALEEVAEREGGLTPGEAAAWVKRLTAERRLCEETWT